jgi:hypothetical protein
MAFVEERGRLERVEENHLGVRPELLHRGRPVKH